MRDREKLLCAKNAYYYRHRTRLLAEQNARNAANRQDRINYSRHYRLVQKTLVGVTYPPLSVVCHGRG